MLGGQILSGRVNGVEKFAVDGSGKITTPSVGAAAFVPDKLTLTAIAFNGAFGGAVLSQGLIQGGSTPIIAIANVDLPQGAVVSKFRICGRDNDAQGQIIGRLKRKSIAPCTAPGCAFAQPELLATVSSAAAFAQDALLCFETTTITNPTIDKVNFTYYAEIELDLFVQLMAAQIDH